MGKRVNLHDYIAYRRKLSEMTVELDDTAEYIYSCMVDLALAGKWKEWADSHPLGIDYEFTEDMLIDTGDRCIEALADVLDALYDAIEVFAYESGDMKE
ncbi:MAG: hypothetical protein LBC81_03335 [Tannerellaceae bacterium]|jgi:hypothetical protein|nr:hypothetical protein [Tannerellaceae bacterium]